MLEMENEKLRITYEHTEYDDELIDGRSIQINAISPKRAGRLGREDIMALFNAEKIKFALYRVDPYDLDKKKILHELDFYYIGAVADLTLRDVQKKEFLKPKKISCRRFSGEKDLELIKEIVKDNFRNGKFYEDPYLHHLAVKRQMIVLDKLFKYPQAGFFVAVNQKNDLAGYFIYKALESHHELVFAGVNQTASYPGLGMDLWHLFHQYLKDNKVSRIKTRITLTNLGVLNIYAALGYLFVKPQEQYHFCVDW